MLFGNRIKELREEQGLLQRQLAAVLGVDVPMFSKIERGDRRAKREHVNVLAQELNADVHELLSLWLADKIIDAINDDNEVCGNALNVVRKKLGLHLNGETGCHY